MKKQRNIYRNTAFDTIRTALVPVLFTGIILLMIISGLRQAELSSRAEGLRILEESIRRAAVTGYAIEGRYPGSLDYLVSRYGIHIDRSKYDVHYMVIASNIMPDIRVIER